MNALDRVLAAGIKAGLIFFYVCGAAWLVARMVRAHLSVKREAEAWERDALDARLELLRVREGGKKKGGRHPAPPFVPADVARARR